MPGMMFKEDGLTETERYVSMEELKAGTHLETGLRFFNGDVCSENCPSVLPGLTDDVSKHCLALVPRCNFPSMGGVCKKWMSYMGSKELLIIRKLAGLEEEWIYVLTKSSESRKARWKALDSLGNVRLALPYMPGPVKIGFSVVTVNGKLFIIGGYSEINGTRVVSSDVYQYDSCLNRLVLIVSSVASS